MSKNVRNFKGYNNKSGSVNNGNKTKVAQITQERMQNKMCKANLTSIAGTQKIN